MSVLLFTTASERFMFSGLQRGILAARILQNGATGRVLAVFERSIYIDLADGIVCIGGVGLTASPLTLISTAPETMNWRASGIRVNDQVSMSSDILNIGARFGFRLLETRDWLPDPPRIGWNPVNLARGLVAFRNACTGYVPNEGLGCFIYQRPDFLVCNVYAKRAQEPIEKLTHWAFEAIRFPDRAGPVDRHLITPLLGLGPGLTPSGDDFVGGMMIGLCSLGETTLCRNLWVASQPLAIAAGNPIALAHLAAASEGLANIALHQTLVAIIEGQIECLCTLRTAIDRVGHTSGWDGMAGVVRILQAWLHARKNSVELI
jgi:hypothetical protein